MSIALIDYRAGNLASVGKALAHLGADIRTPEQPADLRRARAVIVPGVGNFRATSALDARWRAAIVAAIEDGRPVLGICLGMQWLFDGSEEAPELSGLGLMSGTCRLIRAGVLKVPHVGWNSLHLVRSSWLLEGVGEGDQVYFTHSFAAPVGADCIATTTYGVRFGAAVERGHVGGVQFHPEKSGDVGLRILSNFLKKAVPDFEP